VSVHRLFHSPWSSLVVFEFKFCCLHHSDVRSIPI
jgi:hypothetical protein